MSSMISEAARFTLKKSKAFCLPVSPKSRRFGSSANICSNVFTNALLALKIGMHRLSDNKHGTLMVVELGLVLNKQTLAFLEAKCLFDDSNDYSVWLRLRRDR